MRRASKILLTLGALGFVSIATAALFWLEILPPRDLSERPSETYDNTAELAAALNEGGLPCAYGGHKAARESDYGFCLDKNETAGVALFLRTFTPDIGDKIEREHRRCGYFGAVMGPSWLIKVSDKGEGEAVLEAIGGRYIEGNECN